MPAQSSNTAVRQTNGLFRPSVVLFVSVLAPIVVAVLVYQLDSFDPAPIPPHELSTAPPLKAPLVNARLLEGAELLGKGKLDGPEDIAYDPKSDLIYTGCNDGWIKKVAVNESSSSDSVVQNWVNTGGRPLGLVFGHNDELIVADAYKGLLNISKDGDIELLTDSAEQVNFKLTDAVDVADDGTIYFTDASSKYDLHQHIWDLLEGRPYGRLLSYDPLTKETKVLVRNLYFANGIAVSPDQNFVIFCETPLRRCRKINIKGEKKGEIGRFVDDLPGYPDNFLYDGEGHYWIALASGVVDAWEISFRNPFIRKITVMIDKYFGRMSMEKNSGAFAVDLEGKPVAHYYDSKLAFMSSTVKIQNHLYCGSVKDPFMIRLNLDLYNAS